MYWFGANQPAKAPLRSGLDQTTVSSNNPAFAYANHQQTNQPASASSRPVQQMAFGSKQLKTVEILSTENDVPIEFYGKLEDQFGNAVTSAAVNFSVRVYNGRRATVDRGKVISDANGLFNISGYRGESLSTVPEKAGYALASLNGGGFYTHLKPDQERVQSDANNPVVIKMWKLQGSEPLVPITHTYKLRYTDAPIVFDLLSGKVVGAGGDLKLTVSREDGVITGRNRLDWGVQIEAVNGGLMNAEGREAITYWAPAEGCQPRVSLHFSAKAPYKWAEGFNRGFFVMSRAGQVFSKLGISFSINYDPNGLLYVTLAGVANTNGSRNWESDPNMINAVAN